MSYTESTHGIYEGRHDEAIIFDALLELESELGLSRAEYIVVGGASLVLRGIRAKTFDLDMLVSPTGFDQLLMAGAQIKDLPYPAVKRGDDNKSLGLFASASHVPVSATTHLPGNGTYPMSFDSVRASTEYIQGIPCISLEEMIASKTALARPKDISDLKLLAGHIGRALPLPTPQHFYNPMY